MELLTGEPLQAEWLDLLIRQIHPHEGMEIAARISSSEEGDTIGVAERQEETTYAEAA